MQLRFNRANGEVDQLVDALMEKVGGIHHPEITREMIIAALKAGQDTSYLADLKLLSNTMKEMRYTTTVFAPYRHKKKVTIFGSARTPPDDPMYKKCVSFARLLTEKGYMTITGGGGGIMQAGNEGSGSESTFAANIKLPFEQSANPVMLKNPRLITYKYFFNRKVAFVKESDAIAVFPGGFGTLDEAMEVFTLVQTGKTSPKPLVLVDTEDGYWEHFFRFIKDRLLVMGFISAEDFSIFTITKSPEEAVQVIEEFYTNYHSIRFVNGDLIIRLTKQLTPEQIEMLENEFPELRENGSRIELISARPEEADEPDLMELPRIAFRFHHQHYGLLIAFIRRLNSF